MKKIKLVNVINDTITTFVFDNDYSIYNKILKLKLSDTEKNTSVFIEHEDFEEIEEYNRTVIDEDDFRHRYINLYPYRCLMQKLETSIARMN